ncbi:T9SS type A sorting domain-containing protein [candidate division KSB1 bacterium]|nr:T9SS type A sorting domain-containing protein [candidate division KSB1 bacterium]
MNKKNANMFITSFILVSLIFLGINQLTAQTTLIEMGSEWTYLDDGTDQGTAWIDPAFDDSNWGLDFAQLGYGDGDEATVIEYGPDSDNKYITYYFRHTFEVADPSEISSLSLQVLHDDGAVVYLNGVEIERINLPEGLIDYLTETPTDHENVIAESFEDASNLVAGTNVMAVEVHQVGGSSSDLSFDLQLVGSAAVIEPIVNPGSVWNYLDDGSDQGFDWIEPEFDDSGWASGPGELGYGDGDEATVVSYGSDDSNKYPTTYFRYSFDLPDPDRYSELILSVKYDDGAVIYFNGYEVERINMPEGDIYYLTFTPDDDDSESSSVEDTQDLLPGTNLIAVEIHQTNATSSDISFDLELVGALANPDAVDMPVANAPEGFALLQNYPNPFNPSTTISFTLEKAEHTTVQIFNVAGQVVYTLMNQELNAGSHQILFDSHKLVSGIYFCKIQSGSYSDMKKMILMK